MRVSNVLGLFKSQKSSEAYSNFLKQNPSLEEVLKHENTIQEISQGNSSIPAYFTSNTLYALINYITSDPETVTKDSYRLPFLAAQFFCSEQVKLMHFFYKDENLLLYLLKFLQTDTEINPTLAGYFCKACEILVMLNPERFLTVLFENQFESGLFRHLYSSSIADVLVKVLIFTSEFSQFVTKYVILVNQAVEMIRCQDFFVSTLASQVVQRVVLSSFERMYSVYLSKDFLAELLKGVQTHQEFIVRSKLKVFLVVMQKNGNRQDLIVVSVLQVMIPAFEAILKSGLEGMNESCVCVIELVRHMCWLNHESCNLGLAKSAVFQILLDLLQKSPWSTIFHNIFLSLCRTVLINNTFLTNFLLKDVKIQSFIVNFANNPYVEIKNKKIRVGFVAQLFVLANDLLKISEDDSSIKEILQFTEGWDEFVFDLLKTKNAVENKQLGYAENTLFDDSKSSNDLLSEDELNDFEVIDEKIEEKCEEECLDYEVIKESCEEVDEDKENKRKSVKKDMEQLMKVGNFIVDKILGEALQEIVNQRSVEKVAKTDEVLFGPVNYWKIEVSIGNLEDL